MAFIFDHLTAFLVGTTLLVGLLFVQQRGRQSAVEASIRYQTEVQAAAFVETLTRDLENARTKEQAVTAFGAYEADDLGGPTERAVGIHEIHGETEWIEFVTLAEPEAGSASPLVPVAYRKEATGEQVTANGQIRNLYRIVRYTLQGAQWVEAGSSPSTVVGFDVSIPSGAIGRLPELPARIDFVVELAYPMPAQAAADQTERAVAGLTRQGATARVYAAGTGGNALPTSQGTTLTPRAPWTNPAPPTPPPSGPSTGRGSPTRNGAGNSPSSPRGTPGGSPGGTSGGASDPTVSPDAIL